MGKKVISFSLYGRHPRYTLGAIANARHANRAYPGWICRFYVADDVPEGVISRLKDYGAEIVSMGRRVEHEAMFWRFLATVDPEVEIALVREADSRFTKSELLAVNEWLASGKKFHVMRSDRHRVPIWGGSWGVRGAIPELRVCLEDQLRLAGSRKQAPRGIDQRFLRLNLYPLMKGDVFIHEVHSQEKRRHFIGEPIHSFPATLYQDQNDPFPGFLQVFYRRTFIVLSIYKRTPFSEYFLVQLLRTLERRNLLSELDIRFYVADNIRPDLIQRLRCLGRVILKSATTAHKEDPQYWKLSILSEKNLDLVAIVDFWQLFLLVRVARKKILFYELLPIEQKRGCQPTGIKSQFRRIYPPSFCGPEPPVADIDNLVAQRNPDESYQEFVRSIVYPRTATSRKMTVIRIKHEGTGFMNWVRILSLCGSMAR